MSSNLLTSQTGQRIFLPGHFDVPVVLEDARPLGPDDLARYECRLRLPDGTLEEAVISAEEVEAFLGRGLGQARPRQAGDRVGEVLRDFRGGGNRRLTKGG